MRHSRFVWIVLLCIATLSLAACGYGATPTAIDGASGASGYGYGVPATGAGAAASPATTGGATVEVRLSEFKIDMPSSIAAGMTTFKVSDTGAVAHNFELQGNGLDKKFDTNLKPGETKTLQLELKPGVYTVFCPVGTHRENGMTMQLTVR